MFEVSVERGFRASHALMLRGEREPVHWHDWKVVVVVAGEALDEDGLLVDFHELEQRLHAIIEPWEGRHLNDVLPAPFGNASTEQVAQYVGEQVQRDMWRGVRVKCVRVTEAPHCVAVWAP